MPLRNPFDDREPAIGDIYELLLGAHVAQLTVIDVKGESLSVDRTLMLSVRRYAEFSEFLTEQPETITLASCQFVSWARNNAVNI